MKPQIFNSSAAQWRSRLVLRLGSFRAIGRGLLVCVTIALATTFIADHYGGPTLLYALLFGMSLHFLSEVMGWSPLPETASKVPKWR